MARKHRSRDDCGGYGQKDGRESTALATPKRTAGNQADGNSDGSTNGAARPAPLGRPNLIKTRILPALVYIEGWVRRGFTEQSIARQLRVSTSTFWEAKKLFPELALAIERGRQDSTVLVENALFREAVGYEITEVTREVAGYTTDGEEIVTRQTVKVSRARPSVQAQMFYLQNRAPTRWASAAKLTQRAPFLKSGKAEMGEGAVGEEIGMIPAPGVEIRESSGGVSGTGSRSEKERGEEVRGLLGVGVEKVAGWVDGKSDGIKSEKPEGRDQPTRKNTDFLQLTKLTDAELEQMDGMIAKALGGEANAKSAPLDQDPPEWVEEAEEPVEKVSSEGLDDEDFFEE